MTKSTIKEKGLEKDFSALNRITKPKHKEELNNHAKNEAVSADSLLSGFFNEKVQTVHVAPKEELQPKPAPVAPNKATVVSKPIAEEPAFVEPQIAEVPLAKHSPRTIVVEDAPEMKVNIATKLKHNSEVETVSSSNNIENVIEQPEVPVKTSASLAKDRLNLVIHGVEPAKEADVIATSTQEADSSADKAPSSKRTANDALNKIFGQPSENAQGDRSLAMPLVNHQEEVNVSKDKSLIIPWDKASETEKKKARKIMSACVAGIVGAIAIGTFH